jgi:hypothetical protein
MPAHRLNTVQVHEIRKATETVDSPARALVPDPGVLAQTLARVGPTTPTRAEDTGNQSPKGAWSACKCAAGPTEAPPGPESIQQDSSEDRPPLTGRQRINIRWNGKSYFSRPDRFFRTQQFTANQVTQ